MAGLKCIIILVATVRVCSSLSIDALLQKAQEFNETDEVQGKTADQKWNDYSIPGINGSFVNMQIDMLMTLEEAEDMFPYIMFRGQGRRKRSAVRDKSKIWPRRIPFQIDDEFDEAQELVIWKAIQQWTQFTCVEFVPRQQRDFSFIKFEYNKYWERCLSFVGMQNMPQSIILNKNCMHMQILIHEIGHAIGLYHEHTRPDRDRYVTVNYKNIRSEAAKRDFEVGNWSIYRNYSKPYDLLSIMHYSKDLFSKDRSAGLHTIVPKNETFLDKMGNSETISFLDAKIVNEMYQCSSGCKKKVCPKDGFLGKNCECYCPGLKDSEPVQLCTKQVYCDAPQIDQTVYIVLDKEGNEVNYLSRDFFNGTSLDVEFLNWDNCGFDRTEYTCKDGQWIGKLPECESVSCAIPDGWKSVDGIEIDDGNVLHGTNLSLNCFMKTDILLVTCNDSLFLDMETDEAVDVDKLKCGNLGYSYRIIKDEGRNCAVKINPDVKYTVRQDGKRLQDGDLVRHRSSVKASCDDPDLKNEFKVLESTMACKDGNWDALPPQKCPTAKKPCSLVTHAVVSGPMRGNAIDKANFVEMYTVKCLKGYTLNKRSISFRCTFEGVWTPKTPLCAPNSCKIPNNYIFDLWDDDGNPVNKNIDVPHNKAVSIDCPPGHVADQERVTCELGNWKANSGTLPRCRKVTCPITKSVPISGVPHRITKEYIYGDSIEVSRCPGNLELAGQGRTECQRDGTWSGIIYCRKYCEKGKSRFKPWEGKKIKGKAKRTIRFGSFTVDLCHKACKKQKRFLCITVSYGYQPGVGMLCKLYAEEVKTENLENDIDWLVDQRVCLNE